MNKPSAHRKNLFVLEEATIDELHAAIRAGETTCVDVVRHYLARVRAFNGTSNLLVTKDGAAIPEAKGFPRGGAPLAFPTRDGESIGRCCPISTSTKARRSNSAAWKRPLPIPSVQQQFGMTVGKPNAGQVNALATLNIRGERSVTCSGDFDLHPSKGPLPKGAPPVCEYFRHQPDALERAAELDAQYGRNPDLEKMPMYGVVFSFKDPFDTKDMRSTGGGDAHYDIDFPARDHVLVEQLRNKGAIIFAKAVNTEYNGRPDDPGGRTSPTRCCRRRSAISAAPGPAIRRTRMTRRARPRSARAPAPACRSRTNMVMCSLGEETRASCRGPANHNAVALILPHKALLGFDGGAIGADIHVDRSGILARTIGDCGQGARCAEGPGGRLLRSARSLHDRAAFVRARQAYARHTSGAAGVAERPAHRRHPRVDDCAARAI